MLTASRQSLERSTCGRVWVTVHSPELRPVNGDRILDALELNWDFAGCSDVPKQVIIIIIRRFNLAKVIYSLVNKKLYQQLFLLNLTYYVLINIIRQHCSFIAGLVSSILGTSAIVTHPISALRLRSSVQRPQDGLSRLRLPALISVF